MNRLSLARQIEVVALLTEGNSLRATARLTGVDRNTIMRLNRRVGDGCHRLHHARMRNLHVARLQLDEMWSYVKVKQKNVQPDHSEECGDVWCWLAEDADRRAIVAYHTGKREAEDARLFVTDLRSRILNRPQITTDGHAVYVSAIEESFGAAVDYAVLRKQVGGPDDTCFGITKEVHQGDPDLEHVSTSYIERANLTVRMHLRRCARRTNAFSKKLEPHRAAVALHIAYYNFCRVHETLRVTPAIELGLTDHVWSVGELLRAAGEAPPIDPLPTQPTIVYPRPGRKPFRLHVVRGGKIG